MTSKTTLPTESRLAILRMREEGLTYREISERTGVNASTVAAIVAGHCPIWDTGRELKPIPTGKELLEAVERVRQQAKQLGRALAADPGLSALDKRNQRQK